MPLTDTRDLQRLARQRHALELAKDTLAIAQRELLATPEGRAVDLAALALSDIRSSIAESEAAIRGTALEHYDRTGEREAWPGVRIKLYTVVEYDPVKALAWAKREATFLLTLDAKAFEKEAKAGYNVEVALVKKEPLAQIARDLSEYLPTVTEPIQEGEEGD